MVPIRRCTLALALLTPLIITQPARPQCPNPPCATGTPLEGWVFVDWQIYGRVISLDGEPVAGARVRVDPNAGLQRVTTVLTDVQGEYRTHVQLDAALYPTLTVNVLATKPGYDDARETAEFKKIAQVRQIDLILESRKKNPDKLSAAALIARLAPRFTSPQVLDKIESRARKDYARGVDKLMVENDALRAAPLLAKAAGHDPGCANCAIMLGLAELWAGSLNSSLRRFEEIAKGQEQGPVAARLPEPLLVLGVIETWRDREDQAQARLAQALRISPNDPLVLEELGRAFLLDQQPETAAGYLDRAAKGSAPDAALLLARALVAEGDVGAAESEVKSYLAGRDVRRMPENVRKVFSAIQDRRQLESYSSAKSVLDQPLPELIKTFPELQGIEAAASQDPLGTILRSAGEKVRVHFKNFANISSLEHVEQQTLRPGGAVTSSLDKKFQYLMLVEPQDAGLDIHEYRTDLHGARIELAGLQGGFMITSGFASADLVLHPAYQSECGFRYLGRLQLNGRPVEVIAFAQKPRVARIFERFNCGGASILVLVQGFAWIDAETNRVLRLRTDLLKPAKEVRLKSQTTEIDYGEVHFGAVPVDFWLLRRVVVTIEWKGKSFRNLHQYSDFSLFNVQTDEKRKSAETPPASEPSVALAGPR